MATVRLPDQRSQSRPADSRSANRLCAAGGSWCGLSYAVRSRRRRSGLVTFRTDPTPCPAIPLFSIPILETYRVLNSFSLVRLPDRTPLPVASISAEVDVDSWCWSLTATVIGSAGWDLLAASKGFLPVEVEAMINGWVWKFLLDEPNLVRAFNRR